MPLLRIGTANEQPGYPLDDGAELVVGQGPDEDAAGVVPVCLGPLSQQRCEVASVACHQDAFLLGCQSQHLWIIQATQGGVGGQAENIVPALFER